jgi:hypothetical protein
MDTTILKKILNNEFYESNKARLNPKLFEHEARDVFLTIKQAQESYEKDLTISEVVSLYDANNPTSTRSQKDEVIQFLSDVAAESEISDDIANDIIVKLDQRYVAQVIADKAASISLGESDGWEELVNLVDEYRDGFGKDELIDFETADVYQIIETLSDKQRFKFNLPTLNKKVYGIGRQEFGAVFANTNVGKSAFMISLCFGPDGFVDQGLRVLFVCNEEQAIRTRQRAMSAFSGMSKDEMILDPESAAIHWNKVNHLAFFKDCQDLMLPEIESIISKVGFDVVVFDQLDKVHIAGKFNASHEKFGELYRQTREVAKRTNTAVFGVTQASADARDSTVVSHFDMSGSKVHKAAELDLAIGIGAREQKDAQAEPDFTRWINISKNKLNGWHGTVVCMLDQKANRYVV